MQDKSHIIQQAFERLGMSLPIDGSQDFRLKVKDLQHIVIGQYWHAVQQPDFSQDFGENARYLGL